MEHMEKLTPVERRVVELIADGLDTEDIAEEMFISRNVVRRKIRRIRGKVGGQRMTDLPALVAASENR
jgi:DNA-binding CsgD family transcriptional regulator